MTEMMQLTSTLTSKNISYPLLESLNQTLENISFPGEFNNPET